MPKYTVIEVAISTEYTTYKYEVEAESPDAAIDFVSENHPEPLGSWETCDGEFGRSGWAAGVAGFPADVEDIESKAEADLDRQMRWNGKKD